MSLQAQLVALTQSIAADIKAIYLNEGRLPSLTTTEKSNLVSAINELKTLIATTTVALISDVSTVSTTKTYSIDKINLQISAAISALEDGAPTAMNTLKELADAIASDETGISGLVTAMGNRIRFDATQTITELQQITACENIGVGNPTTDFVYVYVHSKA